MSSDQSPNCHPAALDKLASAASSVVVATVATAATATTTTTAMTVHPIVLHVASVTSRDSPAPTCPQLGQCAAAPQLPAPRRPSLLPGGAVLASALPITITSIASVCIHVELIRKETFTTCPHLTR